MNTLKKLSIAVAAVAGLGALTLTGTLPASAQAPYPGPPMAGMRHHGERHPELIRALRNLRQTEFDLRHSAHDFGGHRLKAADLCHRAQQEILLALQSDRN
jgi:hypothetical protein